MSKKTTNFKAFLSNGFASTTSVNQTDTVFVSTGPSSLVPKITLFDYAYHVRVNEPLSIKFGIKERYGFADITNPLLKFTLNPTVTHELIRLPEPPLPQNTITDITTARKIGSTAYETKITFTSAHNLSDDDWVQVIGTGIVDGSYDPSVWYNFSATELVLQHDLNDSIPITSGASGGYIESDNNNLLTADLSINFTFTPTVRHWTSIVDLEHKLGSYLRVQGVTTDAIVDDPYVYVST
jgi:hypothetical protein